MTNLLKSNGNGAESGSKFSPGAEGPQKSANRPKESPSSSSDTGICADQPLDLSMKSDQSVGASPAAAVAPTAAMAPSPTASDLVNFIEREGKFVQNAMKNAGSSPVSTISEPLPSGSSSGIWPSPNPWKGLPSGLALCSPNGLQNLKRSLQVRTRSFQKA